MKAIVMAETQEERMQIMEENAQLLDGGNPDEGKIGELEARIQELETQVKSEKQKYIDRFFEGSPNPGKKEDEVNEEDQKAASITTDDIVESMGKKEDE